MYQVTDYVGMIRDQVRMEPYVEALRRSVKDTSVVVDIGTGIGVFALLAAQCGARKVYAIEPNAAIQIARDLADANGYSERIEFIEGLSTAVSLLERADIIVSDLRGVLPLAGKHLNTIIDARTRFLKSDGILIPQLDVLQTAVVEAPELYNDHFDGQASGYLGLDLRPVQKFMINTWRRSRPTDAQMLTAPCEWGRLDYHKLMSCDLSGELELTAHRNGTANGFILWFDTVLTADVGFSNAPGGGAKGYGSAFFPWPAPVPLSSGDQIRIQLRATLVDDDYIWTWETEVSDGSKPAKTKSQFKQSTFFAQPLTARLLQRSSAEFVPLQTIEGSIDRFVLECIDGCRTQGEVANKLQERFPEYFSNWRDALTRVGEVTSRYLS